MADLDLRNAFEKFFVAVSGMATSELRLRDRVRDAHSTFSVLYGPLQLLEELQGDYAELTRLSAPPSLATMTDDGVREVAKRIVQFTGTLAYAWADAARKEGPRG
jgi:hypothetical protein